MSQRITRAEIESCKHTARQLRAWGVPWPPPRGWSRALLAGVAIPETPAVEDPPDPRQRDLFYGKEQERPESPQRIRAARNI